MHVCFWSKVVLDFSNYQSPRIPKGKLEKVKALLGQDEASSRAIDSFISSEETHALFVLNGPNDSVVFTTSVCHTLPNPHCILYIDLGLGKDPQEDRGYISFETAGEVIQR